MRDGVRTGLGLCEADAAAAYVNIVVAREDSLSGQEFFDQIVKPLLREHRPDLLWIDPALAYLGGEVNSQKGVGRFLRNGLNPLLHEFSCGCVVVHHTNKPPSGQEKSNWQARDFAYLGSAEWANWARAVLVMRAVGSHSTFELRAGKRGPRLGWRESDGETRSYAKYISHADQLGLICWREADPADVPADVDPQRPRVKEDILPHVPPENTRRGYVVTGPDERFRDEPAGTHCRGSCDSRFRRWGGTSHNRSCVSDGQAKHRHRRATQ